MTPADNLILTEDKKLAIDVSKRERTGNQSMSSRRREQRKGMKELIKY